MEKKDISKSQVINKGDWVIDQEKNLSIECYVTKDKKRYLSLRGTARALGFTGAGSTAIARNLRSKWIQDYLSDGLKKWLDDLESGNIERISGLKSGNITPIEATLFVDLCKAYVNAQRAGMFIDTRGILIEKWSRQNQIADNLFMIMSAFAKVGITALIDEITGYQESRERDELTKLLSVYLTEERLAWASLFPNEFYKQIYRLRNWQYPEGVKRTPLIGKITNEIVYEKLPEGVLDKLRELNPVLPETKRRRWKFTQFLSYDLGQPDLRDHLLQVVALMRASSDWERFKRLLARAFPGKQEVLPGVGDVDDES
jgi:hypothetical protein